MKIGNWTIDFGFLYKQLPEKWDDLDDAFARSKSVLTTIGVHLWHEDGTDEGHLLELHLYRYNHVKKRKGLFLSLSKTHIPAYWWSDCPCCGGVKGKCKECDK